VKVIEIVKEHLRQNGFDGLCHNETECGCHLNDFHICGENFADCVPAYRHALPKGDMRGDWWMSTRKDWKPTDDVEL